VVVSNFRAALAVAQHQWPRSPVRSKATRHGLLRDAQDGLGQSRVLITPLINTVTRSLPFHAMGSAGRGGRASSIAFAARKSAVSKPSVKRS